jgi:NADPH:quinone reductase-like Zn-dependent oxidoreductase
MTFANQAAWLSYKDTPLTVGPAETTLPGPDEILIENKAWGINPVGRQKSKWLAED